IYYNLYSSYILFLMLYY
ncbi:hypothetical protein MPH_11493, partial [Macrophomina phaseolina MS6]